jgi:hypothetical protein
MATTTNYSWSTPDDTALVKDGAAAIRSLGTAIDSTVFTNAGAAINKSLVDAAGDLIYGTADNTVARLAIGTADQVLKVNSGATAPEWGTAPSGGMTLISTTTLSGATTTLSSIPQTYNSLYLVIENALPASDGQELRMRFNGDSGANRHCSAYNNAFSGAANPFDTTYQRITINNDNAVSTAFCTIEIPNYTNTTSWKLARIIGVNNDESTTTSIRMNQTIGAFNQTGAISSLAFFFGSGNATSGTIKLYGVK